MSRIIRLAEEGRLPDSLIRLGIRQFLAARLRQERIGDLEAELRRKLEFVAALRAAPVAIDTRAANEQHYEVPTEFFQHVLGPLLKYSCCQWNASTSTLAEAEEAMLELTAARAGLADGQDLLELGCGWGSLCLWAAERYPGSRVLAVSNSATQRAYITQRAAERGLANLDVVTSDMNDFAPDRTFDRVVSVEMFEHMRNYEELLRRIATWLRPGGRLFVHIFCHRAYAYPFEDQGAADWMARTFFTGGIMPSEDLLLYFPRDMLLVDQWRVGGLHYQKTLEAWLARMDERRAAIRPILERTYGAADAGLWEQRWRIFFMTCSELFGYRGGKEWWVGHYALEPRPAR